MHACGVLPEAAVSRRRRASRRRSRAGGGLVLALWLLLPGGSAAAIADTEPASEPFVLPTANVRRVEDVYRLDAIARLRLTSAVREALDNGVDLTIAWEVEIDRRNRWWLDAELAYVTQRYRLSLHELSLQYVVTNLNTGQRHSYSRLQSALDQIGTLVGFPLVDRVLVSDDGLYFGYVRVRLLHDELPLPLRAVALFADSWKLETDWYQWTFE